MINDINQIMTIHKLQGDENDRKMLKTLKSKKKKGNTKHVLFYNKFAARWERSIAERINGKIATPPYRPYSYPNPS